MDMDIFVYGIIFYALSYCVVYAAGPFNMFTRYRKFAKKWFPSNLADSVDCMFCTPFQLGLLFSLINIFLLDYSFTTPSILCEFNDNYWYLNILFDGAFTAGLVYLIDTVQTFIENKTNENEDYLE